MTTHLDENGRLCSVDALLGAVLVVDLVNQRAPLLLNLGCTVVITVALLISGRDRELIVSQLQFQFERRFGAQILAHERSDVLWI